MTVAVKSSVTAYAEAVVGGEIVVGELVRLAAARHLRDLETCEERGLWFDEVAAEQAVAFFPLLRHSKGEWAGESLELEPWQAFIVGSLFGWKRRGDEYQAYLKGEQSEATDLRRFRTAYTSVGRKNGKSTLGAGLGLKLAFFDDEPGAEIYSAATKRDQAKIVWGEAQRMVERSPGLSARVKSYVSNLHDTRTASKFEPLSADYNSLDGLNPHGAIVDEYHAHPSGMLADVIASAMGARRQPLMIFITTAGHDNSSACHDLDKYVSQVLQGLIEDDETFGYIARIDEDDAWDNPAVWIKANPNLGVSVKPEYLQARCERARHIPREQNEFIRKHCNRWTEQADRWLDLTVWDVCGELPTQAPGALAFAGLDLSTTTDLSAFLLLFPDDANGYDLLCRFWCPEEGIELRSKRDKVPYDVWERQGWITATEGNVTDYDVIRRDIGEDAGIYQIKEIGFDPWNATQLATQLMSDGATMVQVAQGYSALNEPSKELEKLLLGKRLRHGGNPVLRWMAANVALQEGPNETVRPSKQRSHERIDGIVALVIALSRAMVHLQVDESSVYEKRGLRVLG